MAQEYIIDEKRCRDVELKYKDRLMDSFGKLNGRKTIGSCTYLYKKYGCPKTYQEFYEKYTTDKDNGNHSKDIRYCGRTEIELKRIADRFKKMVGDESIDNQVFEDYLVKKIIIDTLDGHQKELELYEILYNEGYEIREPSPTEDSELGIDGFAYKDGELEFIMQIKPISFFYGNKNYYLLKDRQYAVEKAEKCEYKYGVDVRYFIYNSKLKKWCKNGNSLYFDINEIINQDGTTKKNIK